MSDTKMTAVDFVKAELAKDADHGKIRMRVGLDYDLTESAARKLVRDQLAAMGKEPAGKRHDWAAIVGFLRENHGQITKDELVAGMVELGTTEASAKHYLAAVTMAKEWARQEVAATTEDA